MSKMNEIIRMRQNQTTLDRTVLENVYNSLNYRFPKQHTFKKYWVFALNPLHTIVYLETEVFASSFYF